MERLVRAVRNQNLVTIDRLLRDPAIDPSLVVAREASIFGRTEWTALAEAAKAGNVAVVDRLLNDPRIDPAASENLAIYIAAAFGNLGAVKRLLQDDRVDPSDYCISTRLPPLTPFEVAAVSYKDNLAVVKCLLADPRVDPFEHDEQSIQIAAHNCRWQVVVYLLSCCSWSGPALNGVLRPAARGGRLDIVDMVLDLHPGEEAFTDTVETAARYGNLEVMTTLLNSPLAGPSADVSRAAERAAENGYYKLVTVLLRDNRVDPLSAIKAVLRRSQDQYRVVFANSFYSQDGIDCPATLMVLLTDYRTDYKTALGILQHKLADDKKDGRTPWYAETMQTWMNDLDL